MPASWRATGAGLDAKALPPHYSALLGAKEDAGAGKAVADIKDPLPRLIAAALLFKAARADPATLGLAVETASERGWRRPLLAWLEVSLKRARDARRIHGMVIGRAHPAAHRSRHGQRRQTPALNGQFRLVHLVY
jgi:hypothetical protein